MLQCTNNVITVCPSTKQNLALKDLLKPAASANKLLIFTHFQPSIEYHSSLFLYDMQKQTKKEQLLTQSHEQNHRQCCQ